MVKFQVGRWAPSEKGSERVHAGAQRSDAVIKVGITGNADQRVTTVFAQECAQQVQGLLQSTGQMSDSGTPVLSFAHALVDEARGPDTLLIAAEEGGSGLVIEIGRRVDERLLEILSTGAAESVRSALRQAQDG
ncbi:hypothetical protein [Streptomyces sp. NPDC057616]|uniref:hypothetical protein n=1 Tax=Streptomyces sp. NPDC057616 TaxID=3346183 RepID=UPI00368E1445